MAQEKVVDRLVTEMLFRTDKKALAGLERRVDALKRRLQSASNVMIRVGVVGTAALAAVGKAAISTDKAMKSLAARSGATADELKRMKETAYKVGSSLPLNTADIIAAQTNYIALGNTIEETLKVIPHLAQMTVAAAGGQIDQMAKYMDTALFAFKDTTPEQIADMMIKAEATTAGSAMEIGAAFEYSAVSAAKAGVSAEEYIATLGLMAKSGKDVAGSSQGLALFATNISKGLAGGKLRGGKLIKNVFEGMGIGMDEVSKAWEGDNQIYELLKLIKDAVGDDKNKMVGMFAQLSGTTYSSAMLAVVDQLDIMPAKVREIRDAENEAAIQAAKRMEGVSGAWELMKAMYDTFANRLADAEVAGALEKMFRGVAKILEVVTQVDKATGEMVNEKWLVALGKIAGYTPMLIAFGAALRVIAFTMSPVLKLTMLLARWTGLLAGAQWLWNTAAMKGIVMWVLLRTAQLRAAIAAAIVNGVMALNPIFLIITAIAALIAIWKNWGTIIDWLKEKMRNILPDWVLNLIGVDTDTPEAKTPTAPTTPGGSASAVVDPYGYGAALKNLAAPLPTAPAGSTTANQNKGGNSVSVGKIEVYAPGADSTEIAENVGRKLSDQIEQVVDATDSPLVL